MSRVTLLKELGGTEGVDNTVKVLYGKLLADPRTVSIFEGVDKAGLQGGGQAFLKECLLSAGRSNDLAGKPQENVVNHKVLSQGHFDVMMEHLVTVCGELNLKKSCLDELAPARSSFPPVPEQQKTVQAASRSAEGDIPGSSPQPPSAAAEKAACQDASSAADSTPSCPAAPSKVADQDDGEAVPVPSIFERLGGIGAVRAAVDIFYGKLMQDARVAHFFFGFDMAVLKQKQVMFMLYAFGGSQVYEGDDLYEKHKSMMQHKGLNQSHFDVIVENFVATLQQLGVSQEIIEECLGVLGPARAIFQLREEDRIHA